MQTVRYDEVRLGDVGLFADNTVWIAMGEFMPQYDRDGERYGYIPTCVPVVSNYDYTGLTINDIINDEDSQGIFGRASSVTTLIHRMERMDGLPRTV